MFFDNLTSTAYQRPVIRTSTDLFDRFLCIASEQHSYRSFDNVFNTLDREFEKVFQTARAFQESLFNDRQMFSGNFCLRNTFRNGNRTTDRQVGVTLNGDLVERRQGSVRPFRHADHEPVQIEPSRLQWYDSNTRRALLPQPQSTGQQRPTGWLTAVELSKLPLSTFRVDEMPSNSQPSSRGDDSTLDLYSNSPGDSGIPSSSTETVLITPVRVVGAKNRKSNPGLSPGSAYLLPVSRLQSVVPIQPLQSSPSRGFPECEVCLLEYRDKDTLRHLPCGHGFHSKCIDTWFKQSTTCPKCRAGVRTGIKRLERARQSLTRQPVGAGRSHSVGTVTVPRQIPRPNQTVAIRRVSVARPPIRPPQVTVDRSVEARRKAGEAAIQRAARQNCQTAPMVNANNS